MPNEKTAPQNGAMESRSDDWKRYRDPSYDFELQYPEDWQMQTEEQPDGYIVSFAPRLAKQAADYRLMIRVHEGATLKELKNFFSGLAHAGIFPPGTEKPLTIAGIELPFFGNYWSKDNQSILSTALVAKEGAVIEVTATRSLEAKDISDVTERWFRSMRF